MEALRAVFTKPDPQAQVHTAAAIHGPIPMNIV